MRLRRRCTRPRDKGTPVASARPDCRAVAPTRIGQTIALGPRIKLVGTQGSFRRSIAVAGRISAWACAQWLRLVSANAWSARRRRRRRPRVHLRRSQSQTSPHPTVRSRILAADLDEAGQPGLPVTMRKGWPEFRAQTSPSRSAMVRCGQFTRRLAPQDRWTSNVCEDGAPSGTTSRKAALRAMRRNRRR
jgi:hypothetical protein